MPEQLHHRAQLLALVEQERGEGVLRVRVPGGEGPEPLPGVRGARYVTNFYVTPEQRNRGLGKALLDEVNRYARAHHLDTLIVWPSELSAPLYRRSGFDGPGEFLEQPVAPVPEPTSLLASVDRAEQ
ncbi:GNAT family N-acetyltransferase [Micromonospora sp. L31]|uniref:GNAT family N-acetyltransferase n=1 Tax=Micromonospora sp. L31 TaxID=3452213 RepID=UPI003F8CB587